MARTDIEYGEWTWNPLTGCTMKSEGCINCWAQVMANRLKAMGRPEYQDAVDGNGRWTGKITLLPERLKEPLRWRKPKHVLVQYMGDLFHEDVDAAFIYDVFGEMRTTPQHTYQTLTKRPEVMKQILFDMDPLPNVVLGVSVENQRRANERWAPMVFLSRNGWRTWVSHGPALEAVNWSEWEFLNQLVCEGESGPKARVMPPNAARAARDFCVGNGIPFFFKQWGEYAPLSHLPWITDKSTFRYRPIEVGGEVMVRVGKGRAGHALDGVEWRETPRGSGVPR